MRKDYQEWLDGLSDDEIKAIQKYSKNSVDSRGSELFRRINAMLRGEMDKRPKEMHIAETISGAIKRTRLKRDVVCYRSVDKPVYQGRKVNEVFKEVQFTSTSVTKKGAMNKPYKITIFAKKGTRAGYIEKLSGYPKQRELLIDKDTIFRVISKTEDSIVLEVIG